MRCILKLGLLISVLIGYANASAKIRNTKDITYSTILENGVKRKVRISNTNQNKITNTKISSKNEIIVKFKDSSSMDLSKFESKYNLKLKHKLLTGYYIFSNNSSDDDIDMVQKIITNEKNVKTVKPNWKLNIVPK